VASVPTALCDACVLYPAPVRDLFMRLALSDLFRARWSEHIHREWIENLLRNRPDLSRDQLERTRALMDAHARDALVHGYEKLIPSLTLPDPDDRHVLAAAVRAKADVIVTYDLGHFPAADLAPYGIEARHPDVFVAGLAGQDAGRVCAAARRHRAALKHPPKSVAEYLDTLEQHRLADTASLLRRFAAQL